TDAKGSEPLDPLLAYRVFLANGEWGRIKTLASENPRMLAGVTATADALIAIRQALPQKERDLPAPSVRLAAFHPQDARGDCFGADGHSENEFLDRLTRGEFVSLSTPTDHFVYLEIVHRPGLADFDFQLALTLKPTDDHRSNFVKLARLQLTGVVSTDDPKITIPTRLSQVEIEVPSGFAIANADAEPMIYLPDRQVIADGRRKNSVRFLRLGGFLEVFVNGRRAVYRPVDPTFRLHFIKLQTIGLTAEVDEFDLDDLILKY
ncbi:hypothetical protein ACYOEI_26215, partial [Singulisphaera rosea]